MNRRNPIGGEGGGRCDSTLYTDNLGTKIEIWGWRPREKIYFEYLEQDLLHKYLKDDNLIFL